MIARWEALGIAVIILLIVWLFAVAWIFSGLPSAGQ